MPERETLNPFSQLKSFIKGTPVPMVWRPETSFVHVCAHCGQKFVWPTRQRMLCSVCGPLQRRAYWRRYRARNSRKSKKEDRRTLCVRCGTPIRRSKRLCADCRRVRAMNSNAASQRLRRSVRQETGKYGSVSGKDFAPALTSGGEER